MKFLMLGIVQAVSRVPETRDDVAALVKGGINSRNVNVNVGVGLCQCSDTLL
jgi:hypothetical protein